MDIKTWLVSLGLEEYDTAFSENKIDFELLPQLTDDDLKTLGVSALGDRKRLLAAIHTLNPQSASNTAKDHSPLSYTPGHLAERIFKSRQAVEGERKHVTMLFADIKGSSALIEELDPEEAAGQLSPALAKMMDAVHRYEGTVNRIQGDGIMALFGAPLAHEDHAVRACMAAIDMRDAFSGGLDVRVGLHCGEVFVRALRNDLSMDYDAMGSSAHLAARMEQSATPGTIRITDSVRSLTAGFIETRSLGPTAVKGFQDPVVIHEVIGRKSLRMRWEARAAHGLTTFVGRRRELESLLTAADKVSSGQGQLIALVGDAGNGKSRLVHEFTQLPEFDEWTHCQTGAIPHGINSPYLPLVMLLRMMFRVDDVDDQSVITHKLQAGLARIVSEAGSILPALQELMDLPVADPDWTVLNPQERARRITECIGILLLQAARSRPMLLVIEDLHWIDSESLRVLNGLVEDLAAHQILLVVTHRSEFTHTWGSKSYFTQTRLNPFTMPDAHEMLDKLLGMHSSLGSVKKLIIERTEGRPLFIEETVRSLQEAGVFSDRNGVTSVTNDLSTIDIPASVQDVIAARIDRLEPELKDILLTAAVIGRRVPVHLLQSIAGIPAEHLATRLAALQSAEFLYRWSGSDNRVYIFKHALSEEVAYSALAQKTRRELHLRLVDTMETAFKGRLDEHVEELAHHARQAQNWEKSFQYHRDAAKKAHGNSAYAAAVVGFERALEALEKMDDDTHNLTDRIDIRLEMRTALWPLGRHSELEKRVLEAGKIAERIGDTARHANVQNYLCAHYWQDGEHKRAIEHGEKGISLAKQANDFSILSTTTQHLGVALNARGDFKRQVALHRKVAADLTGTPAYERHGMAGFPAAITRGFLAWGLAELGEFEEALNWAREGVQIAGEVNSAMSTVWVSNYLALAYIRRGEFDHAIEILAPNFETCQQAEVLLLKTITSSIYGLALSNTGNHDDAIPLLELAVEPETLRHHPEGCGYPYAWLAEGYLRAGMLGEAKQAANRGLIIAEKQGEFAHNAWTQFILAEIENANQVGLAKAIAKLENARRIAEKYFMHPLIARCNYELSLLKRRSLEITQSTALLESAQAEFRRMGMRHWLEKSNIPPEMTDQEVLP